MNSETSPGDWWDSRFWRPPTGKECRERVRHPVRRLHGLGGLVFCKDSVWRIQQLGTPTLQLATDAAAQRLGVTMSFLAEWCKLWLSERLPRKSLDAPVGSRVSRARPRPSERSLRKGSDMSRRDKRRVNIDRDYVTLPAAARKLNLVESKLTAIVRRVGISTLPMMDGTTRIRKRDLTRIDRSRNVDTNVPVIQSPPCKTDAGTGSMEPPRQTYFNRGDTSDYESLDPPGA